MRIRPIGPSDLALEGGEILHIPSGSIKDWEVRSVDASIVLTTGPVVDGRL
jgi:hypothetical protein